MYGKYLVLFALLFTGWLLRKTDFIDDKMDHGMNKLIVYFAYPCLIVHNIGSLDMTKSLVADFGITFVLSLILFYLYGLFCKGYGKLRKFPKDGSAVAEFAMASPNNGFMGFPVALIFFGEKGLLLMLAHNAAMNFFIFTYGIKLLKSVQQEKIREKASGQFVKAVFKLFMNPNIFALIIGFAVSIMGFGIPEVIDEYLLYIGNISTPMAMIFIGSTLSGYRFKDIIKDRVTIEGSAVKLVTLPLLTAAAVYFLPIAPVIKCIVSLGIAFPTAATVSMLAEQEGLKAGVASKILFLSTVVSIATIPGFINLVTFMFM